MKQIITMCILPNISRSKDNQTVKCGHLTEYEVGNIKSQKNEAGRLVPDLFAF